MSGSIWGFIYYMAYTMPILLIYLIGFVLSIVFRKRLNKAAMFAIAAFVVLLFEVIFSVGTQAFYYFYLLSSSDNYNYISTYFTIVGVVRTLLEVIGLILLLIALFVNRNNVAPNEPPKVSFN